MKIYHGNILYSTKLGEVNALPQGYVAVEEDGLVQGVYQELPGSLAASPVEELGEGLLIPAFTDLHLHAAQLPTAGLGYDGDAGEWFNGYTYPAEQRYSNDPDYAARVNRDLVRSLWENGIMRSVIMCATGAEATKDLMKALVDSGLGAYVGKMNSDHEAFGEAQESTGESIARTQELIDWARGKSDLVRYILSPEFVPATSEELLDYLGGQAKKEGLPVQSHMSEGEGDLAMVRDRFPKEKLYGYVWNRYGLFGQTPTVMAHCSYVTDEELDLMAENKVFIAYCPNAIQHIPGDRFLSVRKALDRGVPVGLGSDIGGGHSLNMLQHMAAGIQASKTLTEGKGLSAADAFYLATKGAGGFFGKVGSFEPGYQFDALYIDDGTLNRHREYTLFERMQRLIYCGDSRQIARRFCAGRELFDPEKR